MPTYAAPDGTRLAYRTSGDGAPVVCLPGGPMQDCEYLGELGGLSRHRQLILLDSRGTGRSEIPDDPSSYRCDRLVDDVEALREHLGLARLDVLAHSAGVNLAVQYAARYPDSVGRLGLITPSTRAVGITITGEMRRGAARLRSDEPWFLAAFAALEATTAGEGTDSDWEAIAPFFYGRWDGDAQRFHADESQHTNQEASRIFASEGAFDPSATRAALAGCKARVLILFGELDLGSPANVAGEFAALFPDATVVVQPGAGHFPWLDDPDAFAACVASFLQ